MFKEHKNILLVFVLLLLLSCKKEYIDRVPYFTFDSVAKEWFTELKINDTIKFRSNLDHVRIYRVSGIDLSKKDVSDCSWNTGSCDIHFYYSERVVNFERIDSSLVGLTFMKIYMWPPDSSDYRKLPENVIPQAKVYAEFDDYNGVIVSNGYYENVWRTLNFENIYTPTNFSIFEGITKRYEEVIKFNSSNPNSYHPAWGGNYNINVVYWDRQYGFIYFKDVFGEEWIREN